MVERPGINCEFSVLRYAPDPIREEFVNIGIVLNEISPNGRTLIRMTQDWNGVQWLDPEADIELLAALADDWEKEALLSSKFLPMLRDSLSGAVRMTDPKPCLVQDFSYQAYILMQMYVETPTRTHLQRRAATSTLLRRMERIFRNVGLWERMDQNIVLSVDDSGSVPAFMIDCGYRAGSSLRCFQTLNIDDTENDAVRLAFYTPLAREHMRARQDMSLDITAVVNKNPFDDQNDEGTKRYNACARMLEQMAINVIPITGLARFADLACGELDAMSA
jgi:hypothetical protein